MKKKVLVSCREMGDIAQLTANFLPEILQRFIGAVGLSTKLMWTPFIGDTPTLTYSEPEQDLL